MCAILTLPDMIQAPNEQQPREYRSLDDDHPGEPLDPPLNVRGLRIIPKRPARQGPARLASQAGHRAWAVVEAHGFTFLFLAPRVLPLTRNPWF